MFTDKMVYCNNRKFKGDTKMVKTVFGAVSAGVMIAIGGSGDRRKFCVKAE